MHLNDPSIYLLYPLDAFHGHRMLLIPACTRCKFVIELWKRLGFTDSSEFKCFWTSRSVCFSWRLLFLLLCHCSLRCCNPFILSFTRLHTNCHRDREGWWEKKTEQQDVCSVSSPSFQHNLMLSAPGLNVPTGETSPEPNQTACIAWWVQAVPMNSSYI